MPNTQLGIVVANAHGRELLKIAAKVGFQFISPTSPTHFHYQGHRPDVLDSTSNELISELSSDYNLVLLEVNTQPASKPQPKIGRTNWKPLKEVLEKETVIPHIQDGDELDEATRAFTANITKAMDTSSSDKTPMMSNKLALPPPIQKLVKQRNKVRKVWQRSRSNQDKLRLQELSRSVNYEIQALKSQRWKDTLESFEENQNTMWKILES